MLILEHVAHVDRVQKPRNVLQEKRQHRTDLYNFLNNCELSPISVLNHVQYTSLVTFCCKDVISMKRLVFEFYNINNQNGMNSGILDGNVTSNDDVGSSR